MSNVIFQPFIPRGAVSAPPSKSDVHRAVICAALSRGKCTVAPVALSEDIQATIACVEALGAVTQLENGVLTVDGTHLFETEAAVLPCRESGSTLRFLVPVAASGGVSAVFTGTGRLPERPLGVYADVLPPKGVTLSADSGLPLTVGGRLQSGVFTVPGGVSSQFISGLLFSLPLLRGDSDIILTSPMQSAGYVNMTIRTMAQFGIEVDMTDRGWHVRGGQHYIPTDYTTDGDWSQAAFFLAAGAVGGDVTVQGCHIDSAQGDRKIAALLREFGAEVLQDGGTVTAKQAPLRGITVDASQIPDLVPALAVCGCFAEGETRIINAARLRLKESDRLKTTAALLRSLGGRVEELPDGLRITGVPRLRGGSADGSNDHRIVMAAAVCAAGCTGDITCTDAWSVNKSYPAFYEDYAAIGGSPLL